MRRVTPMWRFRALRRAWTRCSSDTCCATGCGRLSDGLAPEDRVTVLLRHFTRSNSYEAIAAVTGVPVGTVRSRLSRARTLLATALQRETADPLLSRNEVERTRRAEWDGFYAEVHEKP